jgi:glycerol kinase
VPLSGIAGDQHAALFGQACFSPGMAKVTNGTGSFVLLNYGPEIPEPVDGVLTTVGWDLGSHGRESPFVYALEGSVFVTGAAVQWLRDGIGIISDSSDMDDLAATVADTEGVYIVPAFTGLGSPWWDPYARGAIFGLTRGVGRGHIARAVIESMAFQVRDVISAMTDPSGANRSLQGLSLRGLSLRGLRVDGGASVSDLLLQMQADQLQFPVSRPTTTETTAFGAASLAGLAVGVWGSLEELSSLWHLEREFEPVMSQGAADAKHQGWLRAVERSGHWA